MSVLCNSCNQHFAAYKELALHISSSRKGHRKGKKWASAYLFKVNALNKRGIENNRIPLTKEDKENRMDSKRVLCGEEEYVLAVCPHCKKGHREMLPIEFSQSPSAWRIKDNLVVMCQNCGR